ncbi:CDP-alcohol phosphatidyltransferase family protein [Pedobacter sp. Du54]|uniref:CDP-alcohol phosphatidyltransferase family protein n=1 Tax=Pedobacter anseongensis TaxID=3133439 RepID=UPI0030B39691
MKRYKIPIILIYSRLFLGLLAILLSALNIKNYPFIAFGILTLGFLTDVFDGIIARKFNISTPKLRRLDSTIDVVFFLSISIATYLQCSVFFTANATKVWILLAFEALTYTISYFKFKKEIATHSIGAKIWTLFLFATLVEVIFQCQSILLFNLCFWIGLITRLEIICIIVAIKKWTNDVPTFYHALQLRKGKEIKRNKLLNG